MGLKSVRKNTKPTTSSTTPEPPPQPSNTLEPPPHPSTTPEPPPPPSTKSSSSSASSSDGDDDDNTAVSATSSSPSDSNADIPTVTPTVPSPVINPPPEQTPSPEPIVATPISSKRPAESQTVSGSEKRVKKDVSKSPGSEKRVKKDVSKSPDPGVNVAVTSTGKKQLFQRLWSDEDEIVILKGIIDFKEKRGIDPVVNIEDFLSFVKESLAVVDVKKRQIKDKIVRLKKRFLNGQKKKLTDPHEIKVFEISKKIWGSLLLVDENENDDDEFSFGNDEEDDNKVKKGKEVKRSEEREEEGVVKGKGKIGNMGGLEFGFSGEDGVVLREVMKSIGEAERVEVKKMVKKANEAYLEAYLLRLKVLEVAANKMLAGFRKD